MVLHVETMSDTPKNCIAMVSGMFIQVIWIVCNKSSKVVGYKTVCLKNRSILIVNECELVKYKNYQKAHLFL